MGICITYQGSLADRSALDEALREIRSFCQRANWECEDYSEHCSGVVLRTQADPDQAAEAGDPEPWPQMPEGHYGMMARVSRLRPPTLIEETLRGVIVLPPDTDCVRMVFDRSGRLVKYLDIPSEVVINAIPDTTHYLAFPDFSKTSGAPASHAAICVLLRMLKSTFMPNLEVNDDTGFWDTWDIRSLERRHGEMSALLGVFHKVKDLGYLLRALGVDIPEGSRVEPLDPRLEMPPAKEKTKKTMVN